MYRISCKIAGQIPNKDHDPEGGLNIDDWIEPRDYKRIDRFIAYGLISATQAVKFWMETMKFKKIEQGIGSGIGGLETNNTSELLNQKVKKS